ncbi:uncharacterized protein B0H18DRAFT_990893 [Fomitopsis serialis]|uniref:uncharacterized protein n=1 Tax=Fomitopsis serialis TaxID=139415 RepID=UPI002007DD76|nr:uncharacterized protein B0H18DRAFT_990893 [Neoantrodia serialis]KAH9931276.1 hypothetical protein B0H18DRAFT_990893 [Neoantrodia serialis]
MGYNQVCTPNTFRHRHLCSSVQSPSLAKEVASSLRAALLDAQKAMDVTLRLPTEILRLVFQSYLVQSSDVVPLTHVCRRWRDIAINMPELWTTIDDTNRIPYECHAARSGVLPLKFFVADEPESHPDVPRWLRAHANTIQEFHSVEACGSTRYDWRKLLRTFLPNLRIATLTMPSDERTFKLFGGTISLQELSMQSLDWLPTNHFPNLTRFYLTHWAGHGPDLLNFLKNCPNLVDSLWCMLPSEGVVVELPHLRRLTFEDADEDNVQRLLLCICAHCDAALRVRTYDEECYSPFSCEDINSISQLPSAKTCTRLELLVHAHPEEAALSCSVAALGQTSGVYVDDLFVLDQGAPKHSELARLIPLAQIEELWLVEEHGCMPIHHMVLQDMLRPMKALRKLVVTSRHHALDEVIMALLCLQNERPPIQDLHLLVNSLPRVDGPLVQNIAWLRETKIPHVTIMIPEDYAAGHNLTLDTDGFASVSVHTCRTMPTIALPPVCATESDMWPAWDTFLTPPYRVY